MLDIKNTTKQKPLSKGEFFGLVKNDILGKEYELSLVFLGGKKIKELNKRYRNKDYIPNILSFPISKKSGEIFINLEKAKKEAADFELSKKNFIRFLFIHGCIHLLGFDHGKKMEELEEKYLRKFLN
jgi:probable rRNA maturation factor